ncbi:hypothetical protein [Cerasicoccus maritimus]|uniref:hypothetical protein n=1 Tax=Cerasicoccus maritimus TaxID=490089 RepID=UPI002852D7A2|nr:hypothetical protein [Cerasicoccus maritimus]
MSASLKYDPNNELFVRREDFDRVFSKSVPKATFHRWVKDGKIKKARDLDGWYLLNKTLVHQGMAPVDVEEFKKERESTPAGLKNSQLLYIAVMQSDAHFGMLAPPRFKVPNILTPEEVAAIRKLMEEHEKVISCYTERSQRIIYRHGFLDALDAASFVDGD